MYKYKPYSLIQAELTSESDQKLILIRSERQGNKTVTFYNCNENTPRCPMCNEVLKKQGKIAKTYYDKPISNQPNILTIYRRVWYCCKKFQPTDLDPKVITIAPNTKFTPETISYIESRTNELLAIDTAKVNIIKILVTEIGAKANAINRFLKPILSKVIEDKKDRRKADWPKEDEYLALKHKREHSEIPLTKDERAKFRQLRAEFNSKYGF